MSQSALIPITRQLADDMDAIAWHSPSHVYNPLRYAWPGHRDYLQRYGTATGRVLLLGMNPGPWGMAQTGVPFGDVTLVRDWLDIDQPLQPPLPEQHPSYPLLGMASHRSEGSGSRLWGWARARFGSPERFFQRFFIWNYCPLLFLKNNRNLIPEQLHKDERQALTAACDQALSAALTALAPSALVGIGRYAERRLHEVAPADIPIHYLLHPSPANPSANRNWGEQADALLAPWMDGERPEATPD